MYHNVLVFGAGLSSTRLIEYLLDHSTKYNWKVTVADRDAELIQQKLHNHPNGISAVLDIHDTDTRNALVAANDVVISLMPPPFHPLIAESCILHGKHMSTASYVSPEIKNLEVDFRQKGIIYMSELGADPGIDHLSLVKYITELQQQGANIYSIKSMTGALVMPQYLTDNPLKYKFTWNPYNVIRAGEFGGRYLENGFEEYVDYSHLYQDTFEVELANFENLSCYYNRNALDYIPKYHIDGIQNFIRGTLRYPVFNHVWNVIVQTGVTISDVIYDTDQLTNKDIILDFLDEKQSLLHYLKKQYKHLMTDEVSSVIEWLELDNNEKLKLGLLPLCQVIMNILIPKLKLKSEDRDILIMKHELKYEIGNQASYMEAQLMVEGENANNTAISDTVGLPLAIYTKLLMTDQIDLAPGLYIPNQYSLCNPILNELENFGIQFHVKTTPLTTS